MDLLMPQSLTAAAVGAALLGVGVLSLAARCRDSSKEDDDAAFDMWKKHAETSKDDQEGGAAEEEDDRNWDMPTAPAAAFQEAYDDDDTDDKKLKSLLLKWAMAAVPVIRKVSADFPAYSGMYRKNCIDDATWSAMKKAKKTMEEEIARIESFAAELDPEKWGPDAQEHAVIRQAAQLGDHARNKRLIAEHREKLLREKKAAEKRAIGEKKHAENMQKLREENEKRKREKKASQFLAQLDREAEEKEKQQQRKAGGGGGNSGDTGAGKKSSSRKKKNSSKKKKKRK